MRSALAEQPGRHGGITVDDAGDPTAAYKLVIESGLKLPHHPRKSGQVITLCQDVAKLS